MLTYIGYYLLTSLAVALILGAAIKNKRCSDLRITHEEDDKLQDEAQVHYLRTGTAKNVINR